MTNITSSLCWLNGEIMPTSQAAIPVTDHGLLYGDGVFEGIRFYNGKAFRLQAHLDRLMDSARAICLSIPLNNTDLMNALHALIKASGISDGYLRLVVTRGVGNLGLEPSSCERGNVFIISDQIVVVSPEKLKKGVRTIIASTCRLPVNGLDPRIKSLNYLNHIMARIEATQAGVEEAILLNANGHVTEGSGDNIFIVKAGVLYTPPVSDGALDGITRSVIIALAQVAGISCVEKTLSPYDLYTADECFLTGTGAELIPVAEINYRFLKQCPGNVFIQLNKAFHALIKQETLLQEMLDE